MVTNGLKVFNKTAFTVIAWMLGIVAVVAWRSNGNMLALCLAAGLPLGVLTLWVIVHVSEAAKIDPRVLERNIQANKIRARRPSVETQTLARMPLPSSSRLQAKAAPRAQPSPAKPLPAVRPVQLKPEAPLARVQAAMPRARQAEPQAMPQAVEALDVSHVFTLADPDETLRFDVLDEMNYLYKPSNGKDRQTLDLFGSGQLLSENEDDRDGQGPELRQDADFEAEPEIPWKE